MPQFEFAKEGKDINGKIRQHNKAGPSKEDLELISAYKALHSFTEYSDRRADRDDNVNSWYIAFLAMVSMSTQSHLQHLGYLSIAG
jgi:hypothetical protein